MLSAARYLSPGPGAAISMSDTSWTLNTTGNFGMDPLQASINGQPVSLAIDNADKMLLG